jgi:hypothetical protein
MSVQVWARTNAIAATLKHTCGMPFDTLTNSAIWPDDAFTARRLADGDVFLTPVQGLVPAGQLSIQQTRAPLPSAAPTVVKTGG